MKLYMSIWTINKCNNVQIQINILVTEIQYSSLLPCSYCIKNKKFKCL